VQPLSPPATRRHPRKPRRKRKKKKRKKKKKKKRRSRRRRKCRPRTMRHHHQPRRLGMHLLLPRRLRTPRRLRLRLPRSVACPCVEGLVGGDRELIVMVWDTQVDDAPAPPPPDNAAA
jgi:hypothetical protein